MAEPESTHDVAVETAAITTTTDPKASRSGKPPLPTKVVEHEVQHGVEDDGKAKQIQPDGR